MEKQEKYQEMCSVGKNPFNRQDSPPAYGQVVTPRNVDEPQPNISYCTIRRERSANTTQPYRSYRTLDMPSTSRSAIMESAITITTIISPTEPPSIPKSPPLRRCTSQLDRGTSQFGPQPRLVTCAKCKERNLTRVEYKADMRTHLLAWTICLLGGLCLAWFPYCMPSCQTTMHYCTICKEYLGCYQSP